MINTPKYLHHKVKKIEKLTGYEKNSWFEKNDLNFKFVVNDIEQFKISFYGTQIDEYIVNEDYKPLVVFATDFNGLEHILFDGRFHGFEGLLIEDFTKIEFDKKIDYSPNKEFEVFLWFNYNVDINDEYPNGDTIELVNGEVTKKEDVKDLLFDSFGIILKDSNGIFYNVIEMELN
ncbi:hypothetical protein [Algibacter lectus]|uniref:Uncharacterized protein n=1 Tax=Algibacter lectus TaxID=221126 RepID=A0A4R8MGR5_9FLAO|nr:hypothetical protein [Algibacter lectus]MWW26843.1 hypothetical protein [Algibacter lectus]TDY64208.1 hypothetical protein DFQ06_1113 [Algibacter lectus]